MDSGTVIKTIETKSHRLSLTGDGIIHVFSKPARMEVEDINDLMDELDKLATNGKLLILVDPTEELAMSDAARKTIAERGKNNTQRMAILGRKELVNDIGNSILKNYHPAYPFKMFANREAAMDWLLNKL